MDGLIGQRLVSVGNLVGRGEPTVLATISALDPLRVNFAVSESEYLALVKRMGITEARGKVPLELILADGTVHPHKGRVTVVERAVAQATGTLTMVAEFPNPEHIVRPGQFGRVRGAADTAENAILIPQLAIMEQQSAKIALRRGQRQQGRSPDRNSRTEVRQSGPGQRRGESRGTCHRRRDAESAARNGRDRHRKVELATDGGASSASQDLQGGNRPQRQSAPREPGGCVSSPDVSRKGAGPWLISLSGGQLSPSSYRS